MMELKITNIGIIKEASIEIRGITVIAGENNTGKSTISRTLFCMFNSFCNLEGQALEQRISSVQAALSSWSLPLMFDMQGLSLRNIAQNIVMNVEKNTSKKDLEGYIASIIEENKEKLRNGKTPFPNEEVIDKIYDILNINDENFEAFIVEKKILNEFNNQISDVLNKEHQSKIQLSVKKDTLTVKLRNNRLVGISNPGNIELIKHVVYLDDPFVLDNTRRSLLFPLGYGDNYGNHKDTLEKMILSSSETNLAQEFIADGKLKSVYEKLSSVCNGSLITGTRFEYSDNTGKKIDARNLSAGLKTFAILKLLLLKGYIEQNGVVILDEPEVHLHPEWQLLFAEIIVLLQKEFNLHILLNTHSPYFLNAIEVFAKKYGIKDVCKFYLSLKQNEDIVIEDVSENIEPIYKQLARPLQTLENVSYGVE